MIRTLISKFGMKKIFICAMLGLGTLSVSAQNNLLGGTKVWDNWSFGINAGGVTPFKNHPFIKSARPAAGLEIGKQLTPYVGMSLEGMAYFNTTGLKNVVDQSNVSLLGRLNLNNLFGAYQGVPRCFEVEAVAGFGWMRYYAPNSKSDVDNLTSKVGLNFNFNLGESKAWTFAVKPALVYDLDAKEPVRGEHFNANFAQFELTAGLVYHFKGSNGKHHMTYEKAYDQAEVDALNARANELRARGDEANSLLAEANRKVAQLQRELADLRNQKPAQVATSTSWESVVTFRQGKATIDAAQRPVVAHIAAYMKNNSNAKIVIKGYASPEGSAKLNERLSVKRAEAVKAELVKKYGIEESRIVTSGQGVGTIFEKASWNRVSICTID